jgi:hypothetical protein
MPKKMTFSQRLDLAGRILRGDFNVVRQTQTRLLEEITLRNRNKEWYQKFDAGQFPFIEHEDKGPLG